MENGLGRISYMADLISYVINLPRRPLTPGDADVKH